MKGEARITAWIFLLLAGRTIALELPDSSPLLLQEDGKELPQHPPFWSPILSLVGNPQTLAAHASNSLQILFSAADDVFPDEIRLVWESIRGAAVVPALRAAVAVCLIMSMMLVAETIYLNTVSIFVKLLRRKPERQYKWEPFQPELPDPEAGSLTFPMVLVQIPMFNEKEVYKLSIGAACRLVWPAERMIIQVLDDSTDDSIRDMVELECRSWVNQGHKVNYEVRDGRKGYKAGALKKGMERSYVQQCEFVAIFDADFQPEPDFLLRTVPFLVHNPGVALVQARWEFVNYKECLMTRIQKISMDYHFKVEQQAGSSAYGFFGFNGTAGVWRISALYDAGGWEDRTTVEDMDLAIRACLKGWRFIYTGDVKVKSELPSTLQSYRDQQHRWTSGGVNLFRKMGREILKAKEVSLWKKLYLIYNFFIVRKIVAHVLTFVFYCVVIPIVAFFPEVEVPPWALIYVPTAISLFNAVRNPSSIHLMVFWILFENVMAMHRMRAAMIGLLEFQRVNEWVVTKKFGETHHESAKSVEQEDPQTRCTERIYLAELGWGIFLTLCASYNLAFRKDHHYLYMYMQAIAFFVVGFGFVGKDKPTSHS